MKKLNLQDNVYKSITNMVMLLLIGCNMQDSVKDNQEQVMIIINSALKVLIVKQQERIL